MPNDTTPNEKLFASKLSSWYTWYLTKDGTLREKYVKMYEEFIDQLYMYAKAIRILSNGNFPISLYHLLNCTKF